MTRTPLTQTQGWLLGFAIGIATGIGIGVAMDNIALGIPIGIAIGTGLGAAFSGGAKAEGEGFEASPGMKRLLWWLLVAGILLFGLILVIFLFG